MEGKKTGVSRETTIDIEGYPNSQGQGKKGSVGNNPSHRSGHSRSIDPTTIYRYLVRVEANIHGGMESRDIRARILRV